MHSTASVVSTLYICTSSEQPPMAARNGMAAKVAIAVVLAALGAVLVLCFVSNATWRRVALLQKGVPARTEELWFGAGVTDDLNRMVRIGMVIE